MIYSVYEYTESLIRTLFTYGKSIQLFLAEELHVECASTGFIPKDGIP